MTLEEIADRLEVLDLYARYVHWADQRRHDLLDAHIFLPETVLDYREAGYERLLWREAKDGWFMMGQFAPMAFHISVNQVIEFDDDRATARVTSKTLNPWGRHNDAGAPRAYQVLGSYEDVLTRTERGWRFRERTWHTDWVTGWVDGEVRFIEGVEGMLD